MFSTEISFMNKQINIAMSELKMSDILAFTTKGMWSLRDGTIINLREPHHEVSTLTMRFQLKSLCVYMWGWGGVAWQVEQYTEALASDKNVLFRFKF